jgi:hypothetical protein
MKKFLGAILVLLSFLFVNQAFSQTKMVNVKVVDKTGKPFNVAVVMFLAKMKPNDIFDPKKAKRIFTDSLGMAKIGVDSAKTYFLRITWVGYQPFDTSFQFTNQTKFL